MMVAAVFVGWVSRRRNPPVKISSGRKAAACSQQVQCDSLIGTLRLREGG